MATTFAHAWTLQQKEKNKKKKANSNANPVKSCPEIWDAEVSAMGVPATLEAVAASLMPLEYLLQVHCDA